MLAKGSYFGHYKIEGIIGSGGMGVVYDAIDIRLDRRVALKLISEKLSKSENYRLSLTKEAKVVARIDSSNIVKIWEHSQIDNKSYIAFEYVSGENLWEACQSRDFRQKIKIILQIAEGLKIAHKHDIIHRDLKPENIKVTPDGLVKILDFGLAKIVNADSFDRSGNIEGTLDYLSPEQIINEPLSFTTDIFSFGTILYELFTGIKPFVGDYEPAIIYSILHMDPKPPSSENKELPNWFDQLVMRLLQKRPEDRFDNIDAVIDYIISGLNQVKPEIISKHIKPRQLVTVVELKNLSDDSSWDYFCSGFTDDLINELSRRAKIIITGEPHTSYTWNVRELFEHTDSDFIIIGSMKKKVNRIHLHVGIHGDKGEELLFSEDYETDGNEIFNLLSDVVNNITKKLIELTGFESVKVEDIINTDITAYEYYLKGKDYYQTSKPEDLEIAEQMYEKAIAIDPNLSYAHAGLSDVYAYQYMAWFDHSQEKIEQAGYEAEKALEISPDLPEAHRSLGRYYMFIGLFSKAESSFLKAIDMNPKFAIGYRTLAWLKEQMGEPDMAIFWAKMSLRYDPNDIETLLLLSLVNIDLKKFPAALSTLYKAIELAPDYGRAYHNLGKVYLKLGVPGPALENFLKAIKFKGDLGAYLDAAYLYMIDGILDKARKYFNESIEADFFPFIAFYFLGYLEKTCGNKTIAREHFEKANQSAKEYELKDNKNPHIKAYRAMALASIGERVKAYSILDDLQEIERYDGEMLFSIARGYSLLDENKKTAELLKLATTKRQGPTWKEIASDSHFSKYRSIFPADTI